MKKAVNVGTVFAVPLADKIFGFGQLIAWQRPIFYMVGYDARENSADLDEEDLRKARPVLLGDFFDILIANGRWQAIRQQKAPNVPFPCFKIKIEDKFYIESWDRAIREANPKNALIYNIDRIIVQ